MLDRLRPVTPKSALKNNKTEFFKSDSKAMARAMAMATSSSAESTESVEWQKAPPPRKSSSSTMSYKFSEDSDDHHRRHDADALGTKQSSSIESYESVESDSSYESGDSSDSGDSFEDDEDRIRDGEDLESVSSEESEKSLQSEQGEEVEESARDNHSIEGRGEEEDEDEACEREAMAILMDEADEDAEADTNADANAYVDVAEANADANVEAEADAHAAPASPWAASASPWAASASPWAASASPWAAPEPLVAAPESPVAAPESPVAAPESPVAAVTAAMAVMTTAQPPSDLNRMIHERLQAVDKIRSMLECELVKDNDLIAEFAGKVDGLEAKLEVLQGVEERAEDLERDCEEKDDMFRQASEHVSLLEQIKIDQEEAMSKLTDEVEKLKKTRVEFIAIRTQCAKLESTAATQKDAIDNAETRLSIERADKDTLVKMKFQLEADLVKARQNPVVEIRAIKKRLNDEAAANTVLNEEMVVLRNELCAAQMTNTHLSTLETQVRNSEKTICQMSKDRIDLAEKLEQAQAQVTRTQERASRADSQEQGIRLSHMNDAQEMKATKKTLRETERALVVLSRERDDFERRLKISQHMTAAGSSTKPVASAAAPADKVRLAMDLVKMQRQFLAEKKDLTKKNEELASMLLQSLQSKKSDLAKLSSARSGTPTAGSRIPPRSARSPSPSVRRTAGETRRSPSPAMPRMRRSDPE